MLMMMARVEVLMVGSVASVAGKKSGLGGGGVLGGCHRVLASLTGVS